MRSQIISGLVCLALGVLAGAQVYKKLHPQTPCPAAEKSASSTSVETRTITRLVDKRGQPIIKETIVTQKDEKHSERLPAPPAPRPKNVIGVTGSITPQGQRKVGPTYGRELFPSTYVTGSVLFPIKEGSPELQLGIQFNF